MRCGKNYWHAVAFTFCATFKRVINRPKTDPQTFFSQIYSSMDKLLSFQEKKLLICSLFWKGVQGKRRTNNPRFYFTDTRKQLWNCCNIYESTESITSLLKTITDPLKEIKMVKTDPKKVPSQILFSLVPLGTIAKLFTKKKFPLHNPFKMFLPPPQGEPSKNNFWTFLVIISAKNESYFWTAPLTP